MKKLNSIANEFLKKYCELTCCSKQDDRHFGFQCKFHDEYVIASYNRGDYVHLGMKEVEQFVSFVAVYELKRFISENIETSDIAWKFDMGITLLLNHCIDNFSENIYVVDFNEGHIAAQESTNVLQEEDAKSLSLGMPMHPQEDESSKEEQEKEDKE